MNPQEQVCHNPRCWVYGRQGERYIVIHSQREQRYRCKRCGQTFCATKGTAHYRIHKPRDFIVTVVTLLAFGCPLQAIVAAYGLDERTVADWQRRAGRQGERVHTHLVQAGRVALGQVQADELRVRVGGGAGALRAAWLAMAISGFVRRRRSRSVRFCPFREVTPSVSRVGSGWAGSSARREIAG